MKLSEIKREMRLPEHFTDEGIREDLRWQRWGSLINTFEFLLLQGDITTELYEKCVEDLMWFKPMMKD
jgi:hypothetical protein